MGPLPPGLLDGPANPSTLVVDRNGTPLRETLSSDQTRGVQLTADALPPVLVSATIAAEDRRFWTHVGLDPVAIVRALKANIMEGRIAEGGSTITQQVAKQLLNRSAPGRKRGLVAKFREAVIALRLEHRFTKRDILALYLNVAPYGNQYVGAERASRGYFGVGAGAVTPAQAAFLAALPQRPSDFNPYRSRDAAIRRQRAVLRRMQADGALSAAQVREALDERLTFARVESRFTAPHFVEMVLNAAGTPRPSRIATTLDAALQADVTGIVESHRDLLRQHGAKNVAVVVLDNARGEWLAWEGSGGYFDSSEGTINGPTTPRQPGSALKPLTYALAFEHGFSPASVLADVPASFPTAEPGVVYTPRNYDGRYRGPLLARRALAGSENVPAVVLASEVGVPALRRFLDEAGIETLDKTAAHYGLGITLGNAEVRLDQLVAAYAAFARGGEWIEPTFLAHPAGHHASTRQLVSPRTAFWITDILSDAEAREFIFGRGGSLELPFPVAVKTGTSQAYHDNWTIGYSHHVTVGVWVGNFDRTPLRNSSGVTGAGPIFHAVMLAAERHVTGPATPFSHDPIHPAPATTERREICALSGMTANASCPVRRHEWVAAESPSVPCSWHHVSDGQLLTFWPPEYRQWAGDRGLDAARRSAGLQPGGDEDLRSADLQRGEGHERRSADLQRGEGHERRGTDLQRGRGDERRSAELQLGGTTVRSTGTSEGHDPRTALTIVSPPSGATYLIDPTLRREFQTLQLRAVSPARGEIEWSVAGKIVGSGDADQAVEWPLAPGQHRIVARDRQGRTAETTVTVR
ncbi:MAG TPA: penicillin-binding protein 1C [Vicinamibacterales bacterium]|nr:penicillin-binding protein 1C [Vicinamibacterales bacterium]